MSVSPRFLSFQNPIMTTVNIQKNGGISNVSASNNRTPKRAAFEFYPTPPEATRALLSVETFEGLIWEPACGDFEKHFYTKGGNRTFAALCIEVCCADFSAARCACANGCVRRLQSNKKGRFGRVRSKINTVTNWPFLKHNLT